MTELARPDSAPTDPSALVAIPLEIPSPPPTRGEPDTTWNTFEAGLPAVDAELAIVAQGLQLAPDGDHSWRHHDPETDLLVRVVSEPDGQRTAVGVRIAPLRRHPALLEYPPPPARPLRTVSFLLLSTAAALVFWHAQAPLLVTFFVFVFVMFSLSMLAGVLDEARQALARWRYKHRWIAAWHRRFWPALTARIAERQPYR